MRMATDVGRRQVAKSPRPHHTLTPSLPHSAFPHSLARRSHPYSASATGSGLCVKWRRRTVCQRVEPVGSGRIGSHALATNARRCTGATAGGDAGARTPRAGSDGSH